MTSFVVGIKNGETSVHLDYACWTAGTKGYWANRDSSGVCRRNNVLKIILGEVSSLRNSHTNESDLDEWMDLNYISGKH